MKETAKFPYPVEKTRCNLKLIDSEEEIFKYEIRVPDHVFTSSFLEENEEDLILIAEVNCSSTMFRKCYTSDSTREIVIDIPQDDVNIKYTIDCILISNSDELKNNGVTIRRGMPVAHLGTESFNNDTRAKGLIVFEPNDEKEVKYLFSDHAIRIGIPRKHFESILPVQQSPVVKFTLASNFAQIALLEACKCFEKPDENSHLKWFQELKKHWNKLNNTEDSFPESFDY